MDILLERIVERIVKTGDPDRVILFGSRVNGTAQPDSDYDLVVLKKGLNDLRTYSRRLYHSLIGLKAPVDLLIQEESRYRDLCGERFSLYSKINREGKTVYERH